MQRDQSPQVRVPFQRVGARLFFPAPFFDGAACSSDWASIGLKAARRLVNYIKLTYIVERFISFNLFLFPASFFLPARREIEALKGDRGWWEVEHCSRNIKQATNCSTGCDRVWKCSGGWMSSAGPGQARPNKDVCRKLCAPMNDWTIVQLCASCGKQNLHRKAICGATDGWTIW